MTEPEGFECDAGAVGHGGSQFAHTVGVGMVFDECSEAGTDSLREMIGMHIEHVELVGFREGRESDNLAGISDFSNVGHVLGDESDCSLDGER